MRSYHCSELAKDFIPNSTPCSSRTRTSPFSGWSRGNRSKPRGRKSTRSSGMVSRSSRLRIGRSAIPRCRKGISSGSRIGIDSRCCSEEPPTLPITWGRRHWRGQMHSYRFSAARLRAEAREAELNQAIVDLSREDFLAGNFDLKSLFSVLFDRFYSEDFVLWLGAEEMIGRTAAFQRMAVVLEPINTLLETGMASIVSFRLTASAQDAEGNFITDWETIFGGTYATGMPVRWRSVRAWKSRMVIAERIEDQPSPKPWVTR